MSHHSTSQVRGARSMNNTPSVPQPQARTPNAKATYYREGKKPSLMGAKTNSWTVEAADVRSTRSSIVLVHRKYSALDAVIVSGASCGGGMDKTAGKDSLGAFLSSWGKYGDVQMIDVTDPRTFKPVYTHLGVLSTVERLREWAKGEHNSTVN